MPTPPDSYGYGGGGWTQGMGYHFGGGTATDQAMRLSAVFACLRLLSEAVATLPLDTFIRSGAQRNAYPRPKYPSFAPPQASRIDYLSQLMMSLLTDGNAYVLTPRDKLGVPVDLVVLDPTLVKVERRHGQVRYECQNVEMDPRWDVIHIKGMTMPGAITGLSPIAHARETIDLGLAAQRFGASFFNNGALPSAIIEAPDGMDQPAVDRFAGMWNSRHQGTSNAHRIGVLTNGAKMSKVSINPNDSQFLETRQFQVPDIARIFGVPPHLIADASNSTSWGSGLAEQNLAFGQFSLRPWTERIEDGHNRLMASHGVTEAFVKLNLDALLRASLKDRYEAYKVGIDAGFLDDDEARSWEDLPPKAAQVSDSQINSVGALVRAGFDPEDALRVLGLPPIKHTGTLPITVQPDPGANP